jgi:hypothetical protein
MCHPYSSSQFLIRPVTAQEVSIKDKGAEAQVVVAMDGGSAVVIPCHLLTTWLHTVVASKVVVEPSICFCR